MSGEGSESSSIIKALGHPAAGLLTALVTGLTAGRSGAVSQIGAAALGVVGGVSALAFSLIYGRYSGILASGNKRKTTLERQAYDRLRKSLAEGNGAARLYAGWLNSFLDWIEWFFGDAETKDQRAFGLKTPAPLWPFFAALAIHDVAKGLPVPATAPELAPAVLWTSTAAFGIASFLWLALAGMKRRRSTKLWPFLPILPFYYLLASVAAWLALYDLISRPYHWHKTEHGLAKTSRRSQSSASAPAPVRPQASPPAAERSARQRDPLAKLAAVR